MSNIMKYWIILCLLVTALFARREPVTQQERRIVDDLNNDHVLAWSRHITGQDVNDPADFDTFESIAFIPGDANSKHEDEGWVVTRRNINDVNERYIEQFQPVDFGDQNDAWFVDCAGSSRKIWHAAVDATYDEGDYTKYFVGFTQYTLLKKIISKYDDANNLDTTWGDSGYFGYEDPVTGVNPWYIYDMVQLSDGRMIVAVDGFQYKYEPDYLMALVCMLNEDGTLDTTWADGGFWTQDLTIKDLSRVKKILVDNDGNFHFFGQRGSFYGAYCIVDSDGNVIYDYTNNNYEYLYSFRDAQWTDSSKTRILATGVRNAFPGGKYANIVAIDPTDGSVDTDWAGNVTGHPGYAHYGTTDSFYCLRVFSDGKFVVYKNGSPTIRKILADGSALDASFGDSGVLDIGFFSVSTGNRIMTINNDDELYLITYDNPGGDQYAYIYHYDENGTELHSYEEDVEAYGIYLSLLLFNDEIIITTSKSSTDVEIWNTSLEYQSGFDIGAVDYVAFAIADETTREEDVNTPAVPAYWETLDVNYTHLEGRRVCIYADGEVLDGIYEVNDGVIQQIVDGNYTDVNEAAYTTFTAGLNYYSIFETYPLINRGFPPGRTTDIKEILIDFYETMGAHVGSSKDYAADWNFENELFTGVKGPTPFLRSPSREPTVYIYEWDPIPMTIRALEVKQEVTIEN